MSGSLCIFSDPTPMTDTQLTREQLAIASSDAPSTLVAAVAGSGKTTTLAHTIQARLRRGMAPEQVLALVFSPTARDVLRQRLSEIGCPLAVRVHTFDDYARLLLDAWQQQGLIDGAQVFHATPEALRPALYEAISEAATHPVPDAYYEYSLDHLHAETVLNSLSRLKGTRALCQLQDDDDASLAEQEDLPAGLVAIMRCYERARCLDSGAYRFQGVQDLVYDVVSILEDVSVLLPACALLVVDEWHDANECHVRLVRRLVAHDTQLLVAGDADQVIHAWNGADPAHIGEGFLARFSPVRVLPLSRSFRCGPSLGFAAGALTHKVFASARREDTAVTVLRYDQAMPGAAALAVAQALQGMAPWNDCAILLRDEHQGIALENALIDHALPYAPHGFRSYFDQDVILMLRGVLHIVAGTLEDLPSKAGIRPVLQALALFSGVQMAEPQWREATRWMSVDPALIRTFHSGHLANRDTATNDRDRQWRTRFGQVCEQLTIEQAACMAGDAPADGVVLSAGDVLARVVRTLDLEAVVRRMILAREQADSVVASVRAFVAYAQQTRLGVREFLKTLARSQKRSEALKGRSDRITLSTVREAKGREWKHVFVPYVARGGFPATLGVPGEERRLFYVAITRASERLVLLSPDPEQHPFLRDMRLDEAAIQAPEVLRQNAAMAAPSARRYLWVPFSARTKAKQLGARWDPAERRWWIPSYEATAPFGDWLRDPSAR